MEVGLIGCGGMGMSLGRALNATGAARIAAVADVDAARARAGGEELGAPSYEDHRSMLATADVAAAIVASPPFLHRPLAEDALAAGCHVFVEKPMAVTLEDCDAMMRAAADSERDDARGSRAGPARARSLRREP